MTGRMRPLHIAACSPFEPPCVCYVRDLRYEQFNSTSLVPSKQGKNGGIRHNIFSVSRRELTTSVECIYYCLSLNLGAVSFHSEYVSLNSIVSIVSTFFLVAALIALASFRLGLFTPSLMKLTYFGDVSIPYLVRIFANFSSLISFLLIQISSLLTGRDVIKKAPCGVYLTSYVYHAEVGDERKIKYQPGTRILLTYRYQIGTNCYTAAWGTKIDVLRND